MFARIVRFTRAPEDVPEQEREAWIGLTIPVSEHIDLPHNPCFTTAGALYQALQLAGMNEAVRRHKSQSVTTKILVDGDDLEVVDPNPVFWTNARGTFTLHRLPMVTPRALLLNCGLRTEPTEVIALSQDWYDVLRFGPPVHPFVFVLDEIAAELGAVGHVHLCGTCLRAERAHPHQLTTA
jgi:hypothetical protein